MKLFKLHDYKFTVANIWRQIVFSVSAILIFIFSFEAALELTNRNLATIVVAIVLSFLFSLSSIVIHELGHALAAWIAGWRVHLIAIGSIEFAPAQRKFLTLSFGVRSSNIQGRVLATPQDGFGWSRGLVAVVLGGPIANLLAGTVAIGSVLILSRHYDADLPAVLLSFGKASIVVGITNLIPTTGHGNWKSDGAQLLSIIQGTYLSPQEQNISRLYGCYYDGLPAEQWDEKIVTELVDVTPEEQITVDPVLVFYYLKMGNLSLAQQILERHIRAVPKLPIDYSCIYAFCIAMLNRDVAKAESILEELPKKDAQRSFCYWRARAVCAYLLKNRREASNAICQVRKMTRKKKMELDEGDEAIFAAILKDEELPILN